jgi:hypothetical protein
LSTPFHGTRIFKPLLRQCMKHRAQSERFFLRFGAFDRRQQPASWSRWSPKSAERGCCCGNYAMRADRTLKRQTVLTFALSQGSASHLSRTHLVVRPFPDLRSSGRHRRSHGRRSGIRRTCAVPEPREVRPKPHPKGSYSETITTSSPSISSAGTAPKVPSPAWKTTIETMSVAAREAAKA